jgi:Fic family protein
MIGQDLGEYFQAIPGRFREKNVSVGKYRAPDYTDVRDICERLSEWIYREFHIDQGQTFTDAVVQAIVCHVYIAWIHPFGDGNGRTARLIEFYILLRAGNPDFASHILSNFYNETRAEYYRQLEASTRTGDLSSFIAYAVKGYRDGLRSILRIVQNNQLDVSWTNYIHETFSNAEKKGQSKVTHRRRRNLMLAFPIGQQIPLKEIKRLNVDIAAEYSHLSDRTLHRDLKALEVLALIRETGDDLFQANTDLLTRFIPRKKKQPRTAGL